MRNITIDPWKLLIGVCLFIKPLMFYRLMDIQVNLLFLWVATAFMLSLMFGSFKNLWIPFGLYVLLTILMFCDVTHNAYFSGYISLKLIASAKFLGDAGDAVIAVIRPEFWLLLLDLPLVALSIVKIRREEWLSSVRKEWFSAVLLLAAVFFLVFGSVSTSSTLRSVGNLEFFSVRVKDLLETTTSFGSQQAELDEESVYLVEEDQEDSLFGIAEGRNLIVIQMEALQNFVINREYEGQEITPNLNRLIRHEGTIYFDRYYMQIAAGNTSDAEFATNNSIYGSEKSYTYELYKENTFRGLPVLLKERGYSTIAMHGYDGDFWSRKAMYPSQGFDRFIDDKGYNPSVIHGWGILDEEFFVQSVEYLKVQPRPFYCFMVSLTNHTPFVMDKKYCRLQLSAKHEGTRFGNYLNSTAYSDYAIGVLLDALKEADLYENSVITIYGDHFGLAQRDENNEELMTEFLGKPYRFDAMANVPLIIHIPGEDINNTYSIAGGQIDFLPTMAYLMGFEELDTVYFGQNLLTAEKGFVAQTRYAPRGSFITDDIVFMMSFDMVFENSRAWAIDTGEEVPLDGLQSLAERSIALIAASEKCQEEDSIAELYPSGEGFGATAGEDEKEPGGAAGENSEEADGDE
ncbi:MAG: LTA synthase family protein [Bacillota bacterium]|jgi:lipoteichoic acid synthase|nr:LTA synthase family protein [Bacillota bacterium]